MASKYDGMTMDEMKEAMETERRDFEANTYNDGFTIATLRASFDKVHDLESWKNRVDTIISNRALELWEARDGITVESIEAGITFFQGCVAKVNLDMAIDGIHITSAGYVC